MTSFAPEEFAPEEFFGRGGGKFVTMNTRPKIPRMPISTALSTRSLMNAIILKGKNFEFRISLSLSYVVVHTTFLWYSMQLDQSETFFTNYMQGYLHVRLSKYTLQHFSDG